MRKISLKEGKELLLKGYKFKPASLYQTDSAKCVMIQCGKQYRPVILIPPNLRR